MSPTWTITLVGELSCNIGTSGVGPSTNGFASLHTPSQSSFGSSRNYERDQNQEPAIRLPPGPIPRTNSSSQSRQAVPLQDVSSIGSRFQSQSIPSPGGSTRFSDAYGGTTASTRISDAYAGTTTSTRISSGPRPPTPSRDQVNRHGPRPTTPSSRPRGLPTGPSHLETPEFPPPSRPQGLGHPDQVQTSNIPYNPNRKPPQPIQNEPSISGLPPMNGASGLLVPTYNRTSTARDDGTSLRPAPLTLQTPIRPGFDTSPITPTRTGVPKPFSPGFPGGSNANMLHTSMNGSTRLSDIDTLPPRSSGPAPSPLTQRPPRLPEPTKPPQLPQNSQIRPLPQPLSLTPRTNPLSPNGPPPSAFNPDELRPSPSGLPSGIPTALRSAQPSALVTSLPLRPADNPHSRNARISFFDPQNQALLDRLLATDSAIVASSGAGGGDNEEESVRATLASVEEMLDGFDWATEDIFGKNSRDGLGLGVGLAGTGSAEQIEARLLDELMALEKVRFVLNIYFMLLV